MSKIVPISGFPEWLPEQRRYEERLIERLRALAQSFGFMPIETPAVELRETLEAKGVVDKEIYTLQRARDEKDDEANLALHFDLTVPTARYVAQHFNDLIFPFKRYQVQKVWRGERPQRGRFRELYQFDFDIIARDDLPLACDAEALSLCGKAFSALALAPFIIRINSRKILLGIYSALGLNEAQRKQAITVVDKIAKIGPEAVTKELIDVVKVETSVAKRVVELSTVRFPAIELAQRSAALGLSDPMLQQGVQELTRILELIPTDLIAQIQVDLSLARGLDYYTGIIFEVHFPQYPEFGSLGGGGRYDNLTSEFISQKLPGVGFSVGITRIMSLALENKLLPVGTRSSAIALVTVADETKRVSANQLAEKLRAQGIATEVYLREAKFGKQIEYAEKKGIRSVLFIDAVSGAVEVKDLATKEQQKIESVEAWCQQQKK